MTSTPSADPLAVGSGDAVRSALGLLLPAWFYGSGLVVAITSLLGTAAGHVAPFAGFGLAAAVEVLRRRVVWTYNLQEHDEGAGAGITALLRSFITAMLVAGPLITGLLVLGWATACFGRGGCPDRTIVILSSVLCIFAVGVSPMTWRLLTQSGWMQPRR